MRVWDASGRTLTAMSSAKPNTGERAIASICATPSTRRFGGGVGIDDLPAEVLRHPEHER